MKKISFFITLIISIFIFNSNVNASTFKANVDLTTNTDNEINLFYEFSNSTPLANFLIENQFSLYDNLSSYIDSKAFFDKTFYKAIGIYYYNDSYLTSQFSANIEGAKYVFVLIAEPKFNITGSEYYIKSSSNNNRDYFLYFDKDMNYLNISDSSDFEYHKSIKDKFITSFFSSLYMLCNFGSKNSSFSFDKYVLNAVYINNKKYTIEDNENYNSFTSWISDIFSTAYDDEKFSFNFDKYRKAPIFGHDYNYISLADVLFYGSTLSVPDGWEKINLTDYEFGYYLFPKVEDISDICPSKQNCTDLAFMVSKTNTKQNILLGSLDYSSGQAVYKNNYTFYQNTNATYKLFTIFDGALVDSSYLSLTQYPDYIYQFYTDYTTSDAFVYYNPIYYTVLPANVDSSSGGEFNIFGKNIKLPSSRSTAEDIYKGAANNIGYKGDLSDLGDYIKDNGINSDTIKDNLGFGSITSNAVSNLSSFINSLSGVGSMVSSFFNTMPPELINVLMFCFTISIAVIVIKIIL